MIASVSRGKAKLEPGDWERIWTLYYNEAGKELARRQAEHDREGYQRCSELMRNIASSLVVILRQQTAELVKRQFKGELFAAREFPFGDPPIAKRALFQQWQANFADVTKALEAMAARIKQYSPDYDLAQDWPDEAWFRAEEIPEGLWAS